MSYAPPPSLTAPPPTTPPHQPTPTPPENGRPFVLSVLFGQGGRRRGADRLRCKQVRRKMRKKKKRTKKLLLNSTKGHKNTTFEEKNRSSPGKKKVVQRTSFGVATRDALMSCQYWVSVSIPETRTQWYMCVRSFLLLNLYCSETCDSSRRNLTLRQKRLFWREGCKQRAKLSVCNRVPPRVPCGVLSLLALALANCGA